MSSSTRGATAQIGKASLNGVVTLPKGVVFRVWYARLVLLIIAAIMLGNFRGQPRVLGLRLLGGQEFDRGFIGFDFGHASNRTSLSSSS